MPPAPTNRLAEETSAYLLQHAANPVAWQPWGEAAFTRAREEGRPVFVSIGYSACHWCHVMAHESFEDERTAEFLNRNFVCVKVDREERPDVDQLYMDAVVKLNGSGGWPLSVFCRPDGSPFYGGTYFPDVPRHGMPSFLQVLGSIDQAWRERRGEVDRAAEQMVSALAPRPGGDARTNPGVESLRAAARLLMRSADRQRGGFGDAPKFPTPTNLEMLLSAADFLPEPEAREILDHCVLSCREMARRGLFDQLGGGFHRYCVDASWIIPHFEKMLYDQGLLLRVYAETARRQAAGEGDGEELAWPMRETAAYLERELSAPEGGFYASQDADADGIEGHYHVWTPQQIEAVLGDAAAAIFCEAYSVDARGNFERGSTQLVDRARRERAFLAPERALLLAARQERVPPATDRKRVAAWNGYAIAGLARASGWLGDSAMLAQARRAADFVLDEMIDDEGHLQRIHDGRQARIPAFLGDHAAVLDACLDLYRAGGGERFLGAGLRLAEQIVTRFFDESEGDFFFTPAGAEALVQRPRSGPDGATPNAAGLAALGLVRLAQLSGRNSLARCAERVVASHAFRIERAPHAFPTLLRAVAALASGPAVAVVAGDPQADDCRLLVRRARRVMPPDGAVVVRAPGVASIAGVAQSWLEGRNAEDGRATAWVCRGHSCSLPVHTPEELVPV